MARCALLCLLLGAASVVGCSFDSSNQLIEDDLPSDADIPQADALPIPDAEIPADAIQSCIPNASLCIDGTLETCRADGTGLDPALALDCNFACVDNDHCVTASNVNKSEVDACDGNYRPLSPSAGATVNISRENGSAVINCSPDCGDGATTQIVANAEVNVGGSPNLEVF